MSLPQWVAEVDRPRGASLTKASASGTAIHPGVVLGLTRSIDMKKFSKKGVLLFAGAMAVCAMAMPATSSAASWGIIGTEHTLHSASLGFTTTSPILGPLSSFCAASTYTLDVRNAAALTVTNASFHNCTFQGPGVGDCTATTNSTTLPWTATGPTTSNVQIQSIRIDVTFENKPGSTNCQNVNGLSITVTGDLTAGVWNAAQHQAVFTNAAGLVYHGPGGNNVPLTWTGAIRDTAQTLTLT